MNNEIASAIMVYGEAKLEHARLSVLAEEARHASNEARAAEERAQVVEMERQYKIMDLVEREVKSK